MGLIANGLIRTVNNTQHTAFAYFIGLVWHGKWHKHSEVTGGTIQGGGRIHTT